MKWLKIKKKRLWKFKTNFILGEASCYTGRFFMSKNLVGIRKEAHNAVFFDMISNRHADL